MHSRNFAKKISRELARGFSSVEGFLWFALFEEFIYFDGDVLFPGREDKAEFPAAF